MNALIESQTTCCLVKRYCIYLRERTKYSGNSVRLHLYIDMILISDGSVKLIITDCINSATVFLGSMLLVRRVSVFLVTIFRYHDNFNCLLQIAVVACWRASILSLPNRNTIWEAFTGAIMFLHNFFAGVCSEFIEEYLNTLHLVDDVYIDCFSKFLSFP